MRYRLISLSLYPKAHPITFFYTALTPSSPFFLFPLPLQAGPAAATLTTTWTRSDLSWPSAIPTLSSTDKILYGIGRRYA